MREQNYVCVGMQAYIIVQYIFSPTSFNHILKIKVPTNIFFIYTTFFDQMAICIEKHVDRRFTIKLFTILLHKI